MSLRQGARVRHYVIEELIAKGGMGSVWRAQDTRLREAVAIKAVANDLEVKLPSSSERPDPDIARAAVQALESRITVPHERIKVMVRNGWITLEGDVDWQYQKEAAEEAVRYLYGVKGVTNLIIVKPQVTASVVKAVCKVVAGSVRVVVTGGSGG